MKDPENKGMIADVYWYNLDPRPDNYDWVYNHELKIREYGEGDPDLDKVQSIETSTRETATPKST